MQNKTRIAIIGAMECEVNLLKSMLEDCKETVSGNIVLYTGKINGHEIILSRSGVGKVNAGIRVQYIADFFKPQYIINTGVAGGLAPELSIGDIVIGTSLVQYDFDVTALGYALGYMCTGVNKDKPTVFYSDEKLADVYEKAVKESGFQSAVHRGVIATGDTFISDNERKTGIREVFNAKAVEMEGCAVAQGAYLNNIPFIVVRAISDLANGESPKSLENFETMMAEVSAKTVAVLLHEI